MQPLEQALPTAYTLLRCSPLDTEQSDGISLCQATEEHALSPTFLLFLTLTFPAQGPPNSQQLRVGGQIMKRT